VNGLRLAVFGVAGAGLEFDPLSGVYVEAVYVQNPVKVRAGGAAGGTGVAEDVAALDFGAGGDFEFGHVEIHGFEALTVVNADSISEDIKLLSEGDGACSNGANGFSSGSALVDAAVVVAGGFAVVEALYAKRRGHTAGNGRGQRICPEAGVRDFLFE
jgi:hypothetical protein